jgi:hypothetical protein
LIRANAFQPFTPIGLNLKPVHQQRYEEVRRWRREQQEGSGFGVQGSELKCEVRSLTAALCKSAT